MANELFDVEPVKNEFLRNVGPEYGRTFTKQQLDLAVYLLNDFCNNLSANGLVLIRYTPQQASQPTPAPQPMPQRQRQFLPPQGQGTYAQNPFESEYDVQRNIEEMNAQLQPRQVPQDADYYEPQPAPQPLPQPRGPGRPRNIPQAPQDDVNLANEKPRTFVDKIKEMRVGKKPERINPEED